MAKRRTVQQTFPDQIADVGVNLKYIQSRIGLPDSNGCRPYLGAHHRQGYGFVGGYRLATEKRLMMTVHRLLMKQKMNSDLRGKEVIHSCGNMWCCEINHLFVGTEKDIHDGIRSRGNHRHWSRTNHELHKPRNQKYKFQIQNIIALYKGLLTIDEFVLLENCKKSAARKCLYEMKNNIGYKWVKYQ